MDGFENLTLQRDRENFSQMAGTQINVTPPRQVFVIKAHRNASPAVVAHTLEVYRYLHNCNAPGVVRVLELHEEGEQPYIVLEPFRGENLFDIVRKKQYLSTASILGIAKQIGTALAVLNEKKPFACRNLKPENIYVDEKGKVQITDFQLSIFPGSHRFGVSIDDGSVVGTPQFISPEQAEASKAMDYRSDMYSLGAVLYFAATGKIPFEGNDVIKILDLQKSGELTDPRDVQKGLSASLVQLISYLLLKEMKNRYATWEDLVADVENAKEGKQLALLVPANAKTTLPFQSKETEIGKEKTGEVEGERSKETMISGNLTGTIDRYLENPKAKPSAIVRVCRFALWMLLFAWLGYFANLRIGNPLQLPVIGALAKVVPGNDGKDQTQLEMVVVEDALLESGTDKVRKSDEVVREFRKPEMQEDKRAAETNDKGKESEIVLWTQQVLDAVQLERYEDAARIIKEKHGTRIPTLDVTVAKQIMKVKGQKTNLIFHNKEREIVPISQSDTTVLVSHNGRSIKVDISQLDLQEKLRWLKDVELEEEHLLATMLALKLKEGVAVREHIKKVANSSALDVRNNE